MRGISAGFKIMMLAALTGAAGLALPSFLGAADQEDSTIFAPKVPVKSAPAEKAAPKTAAPAKKAVAATNVPAGADSMEWKVDAKGNKTLVIRGEERSKVFLNDGGNQVQVLMGDDTAGLVMDTDGRKTLVVRGDSAPAPAAPAQQTAPAAANAIRELPYWDQIYGRDERPYYETAPKNNSKPYWEVDTSNKDRPYWEMADNNEPNPPYWEMERERVELLPSDVQPVVLQPQIPPQPLAAPSQGGNTKTIAYYMYQDERGVKHVTNTPDDPRYRLFTAVVTVQRGLSGPKMRFTHESLRPIIMRAAYVYNLDPALIAAVIKSESAFDARAVSWAGAQGLMQLMPKTAREMGVSDSFDPEQNVMGGSRYLRQMLNQFGGDLTLAIAAYNCGPTRVAKVWRVPNIAETQNYVVIVLRNYDRYKQIF